MTLFSRILCASLLFALPAHAVGAFPAKSGIVLNMSNGHVLYAHKANLSLPPASLAKLMTLFLALDAVRNKQISPQSLVNVSRQAANTGGSSMRLRAGENVALHDLLAGMAVVSGNDAATAVALRLSKGNVNDFVKRMNRKAGALGLKRTRFQNPTGLPAPEQTSTAREMALLARAYLRAHPQAQSLHALPSITHRGRTLYNTNGLLGTQGIDGLKTGFTNAGYNVIVTARNDKTRLLAVVMGAKNRTARDAAVGELLERGFNAKRAMR
ncbi:MAG: D-alanyl-D-alanine carboxypeptidase [Desulfovibrio sp.]|jgi:D-alanyl-D-alanine carboxypeptidase (penicillin-binding protein 5/6)|nr:D-alanyl-D-alanine carboxypeptidase [Desulfovibrio sp.]